MMNFFGALALVCLASSADAVSVGGGRWEPSETVEDLKKEKPGPIRNDKKAEATPCTKLVAEVKEEWEALDKTLKTMREEIAEEKTEETPRNQ